MLMRSFYEFHFLALLKTNVKDILYKADAFYQLV